MRETLSFHNEKQTILKSIEFTELLIQYATFINSEYSHVISVENINIYVSIGLNLVIHVIINNRAHKGSSSHCESLCLFSLFLAYEVRHECKAYGLLG